MLCDQWLEAYTNNNKIPGKAHLESSFSRPFPLDSSLPSLITFLSRVHQLLALLLSSLSSSLPLPIGTSLTSLHRSHVPSPDILRCLHYPAQPLLETGIPQAPHTDLGSLTLLFAELPGLQIMPQHGTEWQFVAPKQGCITVNIGDGMFLNRPRVPFVCIYDLRIFRQFQPAQASTVARLTRLPYPGLTMLTGGLLHSCLHRVAPLPGRAMEERYSFAYLQRAGDNVKMQSLPGLENESADREETYTSREWLEKKFGMLRLKTTRKGAEGQKILTGRPDVSHDSANGENARASVQPNDRL